MTSLPFGELLRQHRGAAGLSQERLAEQARISARTISDMERGLGHTPRTTTVQLLAAALRLSDAERADFVAAARVCRPAPLSSRRAPDVRGLAPPHQ